jgi:inhibitor of cysteine peptidase
MTINLHSYFRNLSFVALGFSAWLIMGCTRAEITYTDKDGDTTISGKFIGFASNAELEAYLKDQYSKSAQSTYSYNLDVRAAANNTSGSMADEVNGDGNSGDSASADSANGYSGTNLQEAGVDESDKVKSDGEYLYIAGINKATIVRAANPMAIISTMTVNGTIDSMYLYNNILILLYGPQNYQGTPWPGATVTEMPATGIPYWIPVQAKTGIAMYDVSNPAAPEELKTIEADGYLVSSRRIENRLHIVQQFLPALPPPDVLKDQIKGMTIKELMPFYSDKTVPSGSQPEVQLVAPQDFYHPGTDGGGSMVTIMTFDLNNPDLTFTCVGVVADASIVYASTGALYCTSTYWNSSGTGSEGPSEQTMIYKFDLTGDQVTGQGYISVNGRALNQFSLGEYDGVLRIATTTGSAWDTVTASTNHVYCVQSQNGKMEVIGKLEDLAPGEELYSARFIGPRGYLVTYVTTDPLFTLDLSDPAKPKVAGELILPGYSTYIQPYGDNYLIAIGKDAIEQNGFAWYQGVQLSIFDISNFNEPRLLHKVAIGDRGTGSEALYNHKAFTFWESNGLLALPIDLYEYQTTPTQPSDYGDFTFRGLYVYHVGIEDGFRQIGRISTASDAGQYSYYGGWNRGIFINEKIYAVTPDNVWSADVANMEETTQSLAIGTE